MVLTNDSTKSDLIMYADQTSPWFFIHFWYFPNWWGLLYICKKMTNFTVVISDFCLKNIKWKSLQYFIFCLKIVCSFFSYDRSGVLCFCLSLTTCEENFFIWPQMVFPFFYDIFMLQNSMSPLDKGSKKAISCTEKFNFSFNDSFRVEKNRDWKQGHVEKWKTTSFKKHFF